LDITKVNLIGEVKVITKIRDGFMFVKLCIGRSTSYISLINSGMLLFLVLSKLKDRGLIEADLELYFVPIIITGLVGMFLFGYVEMYKFKAVRKEMEYAFQLSPPWVDMKKKIDYLYDREKSWK